MTPSEIADWLEIEAETVGFVVGLAGDAPHLRNAAATIRELEADLEIEKAADRSAHDALTSSEAKLKIATEALKEARLPACRTVSKQIINQALARIKEVGDG